GGAGPVRGAGADVRAGHADRQTGLAAARAPAGHLDRRRDRGARSAGGRVLLADLVQPVGAVLVLATAHAAAQLGLRRPADRFGPPDRPTSRNEVARRSGDIPCPDRRANSSTRASAREIS